MDGRFENFTVTILKLGKLVQKIKLFEMESYGLKAIHVMCIYFAGLSPVTAVELCRLTSEDKAVLQAVGRRTWNGGGGVTVHSAVYNLTQKTVLWVANENFDDPSAIWQYDLNTGKLTSLG